jgi:hypothetical protein
MGDPEDHSKEETISEQPEEVKDEQPKEGVTISVPIPTKEVDDQPRV